MYTAYHPAQIPAVAEFDLDHVHSDHAFPESRRDVMAIVSRAIVPIEIYCSDSLPMSGLEEPTRCAVHVPFSNEMISISVAW